MGSDAQEKEPQSPGLGSFSLSLGVDALRHDSEEEDELDPERDSDEIWYRCAPAVCRRSAHHDSHRRGQQGSRRGRACSWFGSGERRLIHCALVPGNLLMFAIFAAVPVLRALSHFPRCCPYRARLLLCSPSAVPCRTVSCRAVSCGVVSCRAVSCRVVPCRVTPSLCAVLPVAVKVARPEGAFEAAVEHDGVRCAAWTAAPLV